MHRTLILVALVAIAFVAGGCDLKGEKKSRRTIEPPTMIGEPAPAAPVPEPTAALLFGAGLFAVSYATRRNRS